MKRKIPILCFLCDLCVKLINSYPELRQWRICGYNACHFDAAASICPDSGSIVPYGSAGQ
jgi:hypothetical protein